MALLFPLLVIVLSSSLLPSLSAFQLTPRQECLQQRRGVVSTAPVTDGSSGWMRPVVATRKSTPTTTTATTPTTTAIGSSVINSLEDAELNFDKGQGGVRLATDSAIRLSGTVQHKPGSATAKLIDLKRYKTLQRVDAKVVTKLEMDDHHNQETILTVGRGVEHYLDPGQTIRKQVILAPLEASKDALQGAKAAMPYDTIVLNFLGGHDMQLKEVLEAAEQLVLMLDIKTKAKIFFHALSHETMAEGCVTVTVVGLPAPDERSATATPDTLFGVERAVASGEIYASNKQQHDGEYFTVIDADINTAVE